MCQNNVPKQCAKTMCQHNVPKQCANTMCQNNVPTQCAKTMCQNKNDEYDELYIFEKALDTANLNVYANKKEN